MTKAKVVWWDATSVYVRCPYCDKIHRHGFQNYSAKQRRLSHCQPLGREYEFSFPFNHETGHVWYEIDKARALLVAAGEDAEDYFSEGEALPGKLDMSDRRKWTEGTEMWDFGSYVARRIDFIALDVIRGNFKSVREFLKSSPDARLFIEGVRAWEEAGIPIFDKSDGESETGQQDGRGKTRKPELSSRVHTKGETAVFLAAPEQSPAMLELLLEAGVDPNTANVDGRTPLMEAALWGRLENVDLLLKYGADKEAICASSGRKRRRAIDFARALEENKEERFYRSGEEHQIYKEDTYSRDRDRRIIVGLLAGDTEDEPADIRSRLGGFTFTRSPDRETMVFLVAHFDVPNKYKTVGVLLREGFPPKAAMSGWANWSAREDEAMIDGTVYTDEVRQLCELIGHILPEHYYDRGEPGRYYACHAEKQLVAYLVNRHRFLPKGFPEPEVDEEERISEILKRLGLGEPWTPAPEADQAAAKTRKRLRSLAEAAPMQFLQKATILVSRKICDDCKQFINCVNNTKALDLDIPVFHQCLDLNCPSCRVG